MIVRRYGSSVQSVETNFDSKALTEIGFRRDRRFSMPVEEFERAFARVSEHELAAALDGSVHDEAESALLAQLEESLGALLAGLDEGEVLMVESEQGKDYPKTHTRQRTLVEGGENRLHFHVSIDPPLRVGRYRREA